MYVSIQAPLAEKNLRAGFFLQPNLYPEVQRLH